MRKYVYPTDIDDCTGNTFALWVIFVLAMSLALSDRKGGTYLQYSPVVQSVLAPHFAVDYNQYFHEVLEEQRSES